MCISGVRRFTPGNMYFPSETHKNSGGVKFYTSGVKRFTPGKCVFPKGNYKIRWCKRLIPFRPLKFLKVHTRDCDFTPTPLVLHCTGGPSDKRCARRFSSLSGTREAISLSGNREAISPQKQSESRVHRSESVPSDRFPRTETLHFTRQVCIS